MSGSLIKTYAPQEVLETRIGAERIETWPQQDARVKSVLRGPGRTNLDLSLAKTTPLYRERITLELRLDAFNLFNHTEFQNLDNNGQDIGSTFGQALARSRQ